MRLEEVEKLQGENIENLARLIVDEVERETTEMIADKESEDYEPPISFDDLNDNEQKAVLAAAKTVYSKLAYEPFYRYITVEYPKPEIEDVEDDGS